jgi:hypothetical protein
MFRNCREIFTFQASGDIILDSEGMWHNMALLADGRSRHQVGEIKGMPHFPSPKEY